MIHNVKASDHLTFSGHVRPGTVDYVRLCNKLYFYYKCKRMLCLYETLPKTVVIKKLFFRGRHIKIRGRNGRYV